MVRVWKKKADVFCRGKDGEPKYGIFRLTVRVDPRVKVTKHVQPDETDLWLVSTHIQPQPHACSAHTMHRAHSCRKIS